MVILIYLLFKKIFLLLSIISKLNRIVLLIHIYPLNSNFGGFHRYHEMHNKNYAKAIEVINMYQKDEIKNQQKISFSTNP